MTTFHTFEEMAVWQEARILVRSIRSICKRPTTKSDYSFTDQITRSARSIAANIAEGNDAMTTKDFIRYLGYAKASSTEVSSHLFDALDEQYISQKEFESMLSQSKKVGNMLGKLIQYLRTLKAKQRQKKHLIDPPLG